LFKALERSSAKRFMTLRQLLGELEKASSGPMTTPVTVSEPAAPAPVAAKPMAQIVEAAGAGGKGKKNKQMARTLIGMVPLTGNSAQASPAGQASPLAQASLVEVSPAVAVSPAVQAPEPEAPPAAAAAGDFVDDATQPVNSLSVQPDEEPKTVPGEPPADLLRQSEAPPTDIMQNPPGFASSPAAAQGVANLAPPIAAASIATEPEQSYGLGPASSANRVAPPDKTTVPATGKRAKRAKRAKARAKSVDKGKFRETMWFKKGELDAVAAVEAAKSKDDKALDKADGMAMEERYSDDGTITDRDRDRLSLRSGGTGSQNSVRKKSHSIGQRVSEEELVAEMTGGNKKLIIAGIAAAIVVVVVIVLLSF